MNSENQKDEGSSLPEKNQNNSALTEQNKPLACGESAEKTDNGSEECAEKTDNCASNSDNGSEKVDGGAEKCAENSATQSSDDDFFAEQASDAAKAPSHGEGENNAQSCQSAQRKKGGKKFVLWQKPVEGKKKKYSPSFVIALSGISCAVAVVALSLGIASDVLVATGYIIAQIALMAPLAKQFYLGDFLAYLGTVLLAVVFGATIKFWDLVPFVMFFGLHPLFNAFQVKYRVNKWIALAVKIVWFDVTLYVMYLLVFGGVLGAGQSDSAFFDFVNKYIWLFIVVFGSLLLWVYDYVMMKAQHWINVLVYKIKK